MGTSVAASAFAQEEGLQVLAFDGAGQKYLLGEFGIDEFSCAEVRFTLRGDSVEVGPTLSLTFTDELNTGASESFSATGEPDTFHGVDVWRYQLDPFPFDQRPSPLTLIAPMDQTLSVSVDENELCPNHGFLPKLVWVVADPTMADEFEGWVAFKDYDIETPPTDRLRNLWLVSTAAGEEDIAIEEMRGEAWFIDAKRFSAGAGPPDVNVNFPNNDWFQHYASQNNAREALVAALSEALGGDAVDPNRVTPIKGTEYEWDFLRPAVEILPGDSRFEGRWLQGTFRFVFSPQPNNRWLVLIQAADGYLPRWDDADAPPPEHVRQSPLLRDAGDELHDFTALIELQNRLATSFAEMWNGNATTY
jgi:hypothetical protein